ncbi:hypothetical protein, partial [Sphingobacterium daejeonense]|uniref:hypothetical protein n=1 Tax=Sphingobacterium daejeonense TaxID=371142 RepID=UPI003D31E9F6
GNAISQVWLFLLAPLEGAVICLFSPSDAADEAPIGKIWGVADSLKKKKKKKKKKGRKKKKKKKKIGRKRKKKKRERKNKKKKKKKEKKKENRNT